MGKQMRELISKTVSSLDGSCCCCQLLASVMLLLERTDAALCD
jgi:hypothetical protein